MRTFDRWRAPFFWKLSVSFRKRRDQLRRALGLAIPGEYRLCRYYGADFLVQDDGIGAELLLHRFEWGQLQRFINACRKLRPHVFIDVGGNIGTYTCIVGRSNLASKLIAFEPDERNADHFAIHLKINGLSDRAAMHRIAIGEETKTAQFHQEAGVHGALSRIVEEGGTTHVLVRRLDDVVEIKDCAIALKIDVEGHEVSVLNGAENTLRNNWGYAQIESLTSGDIIAKRMEKFGWMLTYRFPDEYIFEKGKI